MIRAGLLLVLVLTASLGCGRASESKPIGDPPASRREERPCELRVVEDGRLVAAEGVVVLRDPRRGVKLSEVAIAGGVGRAHDLPPELIAEISLDGWCDAIVRLTCKDGVVAIPVESLRRGTRIRATPVFTPGIPSCGTIVLQAYAPHPCTTLEWIARSRGRPEAPEWFLDLGAWGDTCFGASVCAPSVGHWTVTVEPRFVPSRGRGMLDLGRLPIDYAPPAIIARLELPPDAEIPVDDLRVHLRWDDRGVKNCFMRALLPAPVSLDLRVHAHIDPEGDGDIDLEWGALRGRLEGCSLAAAPESIRLEWNIWVDTYVSAPDRELLRATRFECRSASGRVIPDDSPGSCIFRGLSPGKHTIVAHRPRGGPWTYDFEIPTDQATDRFLIPRLEPFADLKLERK